MAFLDFKLVEWTLGPTHGSYWVVEDRFAAGAYPSRSVPPPPGQIPDNTKALLDAGVTCFVNLTEDQPGSGTPEEAFHHYQEYVAGTAVVVPHRIVDVSVPTVAEMVSTLDTIDLHIGAGDGTYVHCWGGKGRTGTVVGCWLIRHEYASPGDAESTLTGLRRGDLRAGHEPSPDTLEQRKFIRSWKPGR